MTDEDKIIRDFTEEKYKFGFTTDIEQEFAPKGLSEETIRFC